MGPELARGNASTAPRSACRRQPRPRRKLTGWRARRRHIACSATRGRHSHRRRSVTRSIAVTANPLPRMRRPQRPSRSTSSAGPRRRRGTRTIHASLGLLAGSRLYKRSCLVVLRTSKISARDPPSHWWPGRGHGCRRGYLTICTARGFRMPASRAEFGLHDCRLRLLSLLQICTLACGTEPRLRRRESCWNKPAGTSARVPKSLSFPRSSHSPSEDGKGVVRSTRRRAAGLCCGRSQGPSW